MSVTTNNFILFKLLLNYSPVWPIETCIISSPPDVHFVSAFFNQEILFVLNPILLPNFLLPNIFFWFSYTFTNKVTFTLPYLKQTQYCTAYLANCSLLLKLKNCSLWTDRLTTAQFSNELPGAQNVMNIQHKYKPLQTYLYIFSGVLLTTYICWWWWGGGGGIGFLKHYYSLLHLEEYLKYVYCRWQGDQILIENKNNMQLKNPSKSTHVMTHAPYFSCILFTLTNNTKKKKHRTLEHVGSTRKCSVS